MSSFLISLQFATLLTLSQFDFGRCHCGHQCHCSAPQGCHYLTARGNFISVFFRCHLTDFTRLFPKGKEVVLGLLFTSETIDGPRG